MPARPHGSNTVTQTTSRTDQAFETRIPARMDRLPWSRWHWLVIAALGITWVLDGLEITLMGSIGPTLQSERSLGLSQSQIGGLGTSYLCGAVIGALGFGYLTDWFGRRKLFMITLGLYLVSAGLTAFSWNFWSFAVLRFLTGAGIGGEYAAINSAVDELIPARVRGWADLAINGSFWAGAAAGAGATLVLLDPRHFAPDVGWRIGFGIGAMLGLGILYLRRFIPESPRWLMSHGYRDQAEDVVHSIEEQVEARTGQELPEPGEPIRIKPRGRIGFGLIARVMFLQYWRRSVLGLSLVVAQAFLYNGVSFSFPLVLQRFFEVDPGRVGAYMMPFALANFLGPLLLGRLFDVVGRRPMLVAAYGVPGVLLAVVGYLFVARALGSVAQTACWAAIFFIASAGASAAYLTVSEVFPLELRSMAIALSYAVGTALGGTLAPWLFGRLIATGSRTYVFYGYLAAGAVLVGAAVVAGFFGVAAERKGLEQVADPLSKEVADDRG